MGGIIIKMKSNENLFQKLKRMYSFTNKKENNKENKSKNKTNDTKKDNPNEVLNNLPNGVKIKKIEIGPRQILKFVIYAVLFFWVLSTLRQLFLPQDVTRVPLSQAIDTIKKNEASKVVVSDNDIMVSLKDSNRVLVSSKESTVAMAQILQQSGIDISNPNLQFQVQNNQGWRIFGDILSLLLTVGVPLLFIFWLFGRQAGGGAGNIFGFGKSTAKLFVKGKQNVSFKDVAGVQEAKSDLVEVVDFLKHPEKYRKMGARAPKGVLLVGPSGVGKTLLAKAVAGEANVPFYSMAGSEFMEMLVGVGASRVRDLFGTAKKSGKAIIFIDEIDAIGRMRGGLDGGHGEREQTLNQILVEMDGFEANTAVVVLAATNRGDLLDPALLRPGRFDRRVVLELPDLNARKEIIKIHARGKPFEPIVDWEAIARRTVGFSGADLENMLNEAAIAAARNNEDKISFANIEDAALKVQLGAEKKRSQTEEDKLMTAYHEAGHAIVNYVEDLDPVHRISIVSRGMALGYTLIPPKQDRIHETKSRLMKQMAMAMGGRAAEELVFGDITTGASSDISHVTKIARDMVMEWGMSELGPVNLEAQVDVGDWGKAYMEPSKISDKMRSLVDNEIKKFVSSAFDRAKIILNQNREKLDKIAKILVEKESLGQEEFEALMA
jgi:cell division protease FtsH